MKREQEIEMSIEKKLEEKMSALKYELLQDQGSSEQQNFAAVAIIAPPPGLTQEKTALPPKGTTVRMFDISEEYESDWNADMKLISSAEATVASITAMMASTSSR